MRWSSFSVLVRLAQCNRAIRSSECGSALVTDTVSNNVAAFRSSTSWRCSRGFAGSPEAASQEDQDAAETAGEIDKLLNGAAKEGSLKKVEHIIESDGEKFVDQNTVTAMVKLAALSTSSCDDDKVAVTSGRSFQTLVDMVLLGARRYSTSELLRVLDACSTLGFDDDHLIDKVTSRLLPNVQQMDGDSLHNLVTSLGDLSSPSIVLFDVVQSRIEELGDRVSPQQKQEIKSAYEALGYKDHANETGI